MTERYIFERKLESIPEERRRTLRCARGVSMVSRDGKPGPRQECGSAVFEFITIGSIVDDSERPQDGPLQVREIGLRCLKCGNVMPAPK